MNEMKVKHLLLVGILVLLAAAMVSCVLPNTATLHLQNTTGHTITAASFTPAGGSTANHLYNGETIPDGDGHYFYSITPGTYDISLTLDGYGSYLAFNDLVIEKDHLIFKTTPAHP
jgi:hypothetical protein